MLTRMLTGCSLRTIMTGEDLTVADSGDHLRRRTAKFAQLRPPLIDSTHLDDLQSKAVRLVHSTELGVVSTIGPDMNSGERTMVMRGRWRGIERQREFRRASGSYGGALVSF
jgi:hypothetical protein